MNFSGFFFLPWNVIFQTCKATCWDFKMRNSNHGTAQQQLFISACSYIFSTCLNPGLHYQKVFQNPFKKLREGFTNDWSSVWKWGLFFALLNFFKDFVGTRFLWIPITLTRSPFNLFFFFILLHCGVTSWLKVNTSLPSFLSFWLFYHPCSSFPRLSSGVKSRTATKATPSKEHAIVSGITITNVSKGVCVCVRVRCHIKRALWGLNLFLVHVSGKTATRLLNQSSLMFKK